MQDCKLMVCLARSNPGEMHSLCFVMLEVLSAERFENCTSMKFEQYVSRHCPLGISPVFHTAVSMLLSSALFLKSTSKDMGPINSSVDIGKHVKSFRLDVCLKYVCIQVLVHTHRVCV